MWCFNFETLLVNNLPLVSSYETNFTDFIEPVTSPNGAYPIVRGADQQASH